MPTDADLLTLPRTHTHKSDTRSEVWQVQTADGCDVVIKRFEHSPIRQQLSRWLHLHPAQAEKRVNARMVSQSIAVVPIIASGWQSRGLGCKGWLATAYVGPSLQSVLRDGALQGDALTAVAHAVAQLVRQLLAERWYFRDLKTSNIVLTADHRPSLIDVGSARQLRRASQQQKMLAMLQKTSLADGMPAAVWRRILAAIDEPAS